MKKMISFILLISLLSMGSNPEYAHSDVPENEDGKTVNLGNFGAKAKGICDNISKIGAIMNAFQVVNWQAIGAPAVVLGMSQRDNPLMEFCAYLNQLDQLATEDAIFFSANYLNELTDAKAEEHINWARSTWTLKSTVYDGYKEAKNNSKSENLTLLAAHSAELNDWIDNTYYIGTKSFKGTGSNISTRSDREREMQMIAQESAKSALYSSAANCANSEKLSDKQRGKEFEEYQKALANHQKMTDKEEEALEFYTDKMRKMTSKIAYSVDNQKEYLDMIDELRTSTIKYRPPTPIKVKYSTMFPVEEKVGGKVSYKKDSEGNVVYKEKKVERAAYTYKLEYNDALVEKIKEELSSKWKSYVVANLKNKGSLKFFETPWNKGNLSAWEEVEEEFVDREREKEKERENETQNFNHTCAEKRVQEERGLVRAETEGQDQFNARVKVEVDKCLKNQNITLGEAKNLMSYYIQQTVNSLRKIRQSEANIWTMESKLLGRNRLIPLSKNNSGSAIEAKCDDKLEPGQIMELQLKQQAVTNSLISNLAKNDSQRRIKEDLVEAKEKEEAKEINNRRELSEERANQNAKNIQEGNRVFSVKGMPSSRK